MPAIAAWRAGSIIVLIVHCMSECRHHAQQATELLQHSQNRVDVGMRSIYVLCSCGCGLGAAAALLMASRSSYSGLACVLPHQG